MNVDVWRILRELEFEVLEGRGSEWTLRDPEGRAHRVLVAPDALRVSAATARTSLRRRGEGAPLLLSGVSATPGVLERARSGQFDLATEEPLRLVVDGREYPPPSDPPSAASQHRHPAWLRWSIMRCLLLTDGPLRQREIADVVRGSQQAVSLAVRALDPLVRSAEAGVEAVDKRRLLSAWTAAYPGPGGQRFGWYCLDGVVEQTLRAAEIGSLCGAEPLVSGDVAADRLAPWKLPSSGTVYVRNPVDLGDDGFVPAPLEEATLVLCIPRDPTLWNVLEPLPAIGATGPRLADPVTVYRDVLDGPAVDAGEAAERLARRIVGEAP